MPCADRDVSNDSITAGVHAEHDRRIAFEQKFPFDRVPHFILRVFFNVVNAAFTWGCEEDVKKSSPRLARRFFFLSDDARRFWELHSCF